MDNIVIFPLVWWGQIGSNSTVLQRKFSYSINVVYEIRRQNIFMYLQSLIKRTLAKDGALSQFWKNDLPPGKGSHTDKVLENFFFRTQRGSNYELVVFLGCKPSANSLFDIRH